MAGLTLVRVQVESLRQLGDAAGNQLGSTQARLEQLQADKEQQEQQLRAQLSATQVTGWPAPSAGAQLHAATHCSAWRQTPHYQQPQRSKLVLHTTTALSNTAAAHLAHRWGVQQG